MLALEIYLIFDLSRLQLILDARRDEKITEESASASLANPIDVSYP